MKINPINNPNVLRSYQATKPIQDKAKSAGGRDEVTFSQEALKFSKALSEAKDAIEFRTPEEQAHITDVTNAVRQGEYKVDSGEVADRILTCVLGRK